MADKLTRELEFRKRLAELLKEFDAEIVTESVSVGHYHSDSKAVVYFNSSWDENGDPVNEFHEFDLL